MPIKPFVVHIKFIYFLPFLTLMPHQSACWDHTFICNYINYTQQQIFNILLSATYLLQIVRENKTACHKLYLILWLYRLKQYVIHCKTGKIIIDYDYFGKVI